MCVRQHATCVNTCFTSEVAVGLGMHMWAGGIYKCGVLSVSFLERGWSIVDI
jgi:hypothetical protein